MKHTRLLIAIALLAGLGTSFVALGAPRKQVDVDGSRTRAVHLIPLYDEFYGKVVPVVKNPLPFTTKNTCGDCHDYDAISMGWHFNSTGNVTKAGRPGEPWVLIDESSGVQLPLSYRKWKGTWSPDEAGITPWEFVKTFGRHMPGGDVGPEDEKEPDTNARWEISGEQEINCLTCHNNSPEQNQSVYAVQMARENFKWANAAASGLAAVDNVAARLPLSYDFFDGPNPDNAWASPPKVSYAMHHFDEKYFVTFDVVRNAPNNRCYFCHSTAVAEQDPHTLWQNDGDVHMKAAKFTCVDCHRNGLDHMIVRGYEGEYCDGPNASLSCKGCHLGEGCNDVNVEGGRLTAPRPLHRGLPPIHLEKLTCTACHSGSRPSENVGRIRTSRANRLGIHGRAEWDTDLPYIQSPVFERQEDGKIAPFNVMWPAFWGVMKGDKVQPLQMAKVKPIVDKLRAAEKAAKAAEEAAKAAAEAAANPSPAEPAATEQAPATDEAPAAEEAAQPSGSAEEEAAAPAPAESAAVPATGEQAAAPAADTAPEPAEKADASTAEAAQAEPAPAPVVEEMKPLTQEQIITVLKELAEQGGLEGEPVYVSNGKVHKLSGGNALTAVSNPAAEPYSWPVGHDVRPASQSLGAKGCTECHSDDSPMFMAQVKADTPLQIGQVVSAPMYTLQGLDPGVLEALDEGLKLRVVYMIACVAFAAVLVVALIHYGFTGLEGFFRLLVATGGKKD